jgi:hypothetical protein
MNGRVLSPAAILSFLAMLPTAALAEGHHAPVMVHARAAQGQPTPGPIPPGGPQPGTATGARDNEHKPETGTGRIAGRMIGGEAATPLRRAEVMLGGEGLREGRITSTDESGRTRVPVPFSLSHPHQRDERDLDAATLRLEA